MVQLGLKANFGRQILEWYETVLPMKEPVTLLIKPNLNQH